MSDIAAVRSRTFTWEDPMPGARQAPTMTGIEFLEAVRNGDFSAPPIGKLMDFRIAEVEEGRVVFECTPSEFHYNPIGVVHGGLAATLCDSALGGVVMSVLPAGVAYTTVELHVNYVRPMTIETGVVRCEATIIHAGRRMATAEARVTDAQGKLYSHATTTCMIFEL